MDSALDVRGARGPREGQPRPLTLQTRKKCSAKLGEFPEAHGGLELGSDLDLGFLRRGVAPTARAQTTAPAK